MNLAARILGAPDRLRATLRSRLPAVAESINREIPAVLGTPGPAPSRPGDAPRRQSGGLLRGTRAVPGPDDAVHLLTTPVGLILDAGTRDGRIRPRPWIRPLIERSAAGRRAALFGPR